MNVFVFGSNTEGRHGRGAALHARQTHGAIYGQSHGFQGQAYAICVKDLSKGRRSVPLPDIQDQVNRFRIFAQAHPTWTFTVTAIGTGLAGYESHEIGPFFHSMPSNVSLCAEFLPFVH